MMGDQEGQGRSWERRSYRSSDLPKLLDLPARRVERALSDSGMTPPLSLIEIITLMALRGGRYSTPAWRAARTCVASWLDAGAPGEQALVVGEDSVQLMDVDEAITSDDDAVLEVINLQSILSAVAGAGAAELSLRQPP